MIVSNTEITTYNSCTMQHHYMYVLGLGPREPAMNLYRGQLGHSALETYYSLLQEGLPVDEAHKASLMVIDSEISRIRIEEKWNTEKLLEASQIKHRLHYYTDVYPKEPFKVLAVEKEYRAPFRQGLDFGFIIDLLVEMTEGPKKGQVGLIDHKFSYNWKTVEELTLDSQLPKYRKALQDNGIPVKWIMFNQIRTRDMKYRSPQEMFRKAYGLANATADAVIWHEQHQAAEEIVERKPPRRVLAPMVCKTCPFKEPCMLGMNGQDITNILKDDYEVRRRPLKELYND